MLRVLIVDDHEVVRLGLRALLSRHENCLVVDEAGSADEAVEKTREHRPDIVVMDVRMPGKNGIEACRQIKAELPETKVIMLTSYATDDLLMDAIAAGASGYVLKEVGSDELLRAIECVGQGEAMLDPAVTHIVLEHLRKAAWQEKAAAFADLTPQELRVLNLVAEGKTNKEIARLLYLGEGTVRNYVSSILSKLGVTNRAEAAAYAVRHHLADYLDDLA